MYVKENRKDSLKSSSSKSKSSTFCICRTPEAELALVSFNEAFASTNSTFACKNLINNYARALALEPR